MGVMDRYNKKKEEKEKGSKSQSNSGGVAERYEKLKYYQTLDVDSVDESYINAFISDANSFFGGVNDKSIGYNAAQSTLGDLTTRYDTIQGWLYKNQSRLDAEAYSTLSSTFDGLQGNFDSIRDYYSKFGSEEAYKQAVKQAEEDAKSWAAITKGYDPAKHKAEGQAGWAAYTEHQKAQAEAAAKAAEDARKNRTFWDYLAMMGEGRDTTLPFHVDTNQIAAGYQAADARLNYPDERWDDEYREIFGYLWEDDQHAAYTFARSINNMLNVQVEQEQIKKIQELATSNFWAGSGHTIGAIATAPLGLADYLGDMIAYGSIGYIPQADGEITPFEYSQAVTSGITNELNGVDEYGVAHNVLPENIPVIGGKGWGDVYGLGTSIAQSSAAALSGGQAQALITFFGSAAAAGVDDAISRGANGEQALLYGTSVGAAEALAEMIGVDNLLKIGSSATFMELMLNLVKQGGAEGLEEGITGIANNVADWATMGDKSNFYYRVKELQDNGLSERDAKLQAWDEAVQGIIYDSLGGFVSGFAHAGPKTAYNTIRQNAYTKQKYGSSQNELVGEALGINPDNAFAQRMQGKLDKGKKLSGGQLSRLVQQNESALTARDVDKIQNAIKSRLIELGETGDVDAIAAALTKQAQNQIDYSKIRTEMKRLMANGHSLAEALEMAAPTEMQELSQADEDIIANSKYGQRVANELNTENIRSGKYDSAWAENIGTERINVQEYSRLVEAAQLPQEATGASGDQVAQEVPKAAQAVEPELVEAPMVGAPENNAVPANGQQITGKLAGTEKSTETAEATAKSVTLEDASKKYGSQAQAMIRTYTAGQDVAKYDAAYQIAYDMGRSGVSLSYVMNSEATQYLTEAQRENAYNAGKDAADAKARAKDAENKAAANGKTGWKKGGVVRGEGVTIADLKKAVGDTRGKAYKVLSTIAKVTGINIVLYKSKTDANGNFIDVQGEFDPNNPNELRIDINAGLENIKDVDELEKYVLLRTFSHEFTHFIEKWNPIQYNEFRRVVFDTMTQRGKDVNRLIELQQEKNPGMSYEAASREVVAEAMTDILPDSSFVQTLAQKHNNIFKKLLEKLKEFASNLREYFDSIGYNDDAGANALKEDVDGAIKYVDSIVKLFDQIAEQAVENSQATVATDEVVVSKKENSTSVSETESVSTSEETTEVTTTSEHGFTITDNAQYGSLEITFDGKPPVQVREALKEAKFRWNGKKGVWYGKADRSTITDALNKAFEAENGTAENPAMQTLRDMGAKPVGENGLDVTDLMFPDLKQEESEIKPVETKKPAKNEKSPALPKTKKADWYGHDVEWAIPGKKTPIAYSTKAASDLIEVMADDNPTATISELKDKITYDTEAKKVLQRYIDSGYGDQVANEWFSYEKKGGKKAVTVDPTKNEEVTNHGESETGTDARAVHEPVRGSEGPARLLEGVEPEAVHGSDEGRQPVQSGSDQGTGDAGRDRRADPEGSTLLRSTGDRLGGDLQQLQAVTEKPDALTSHAAAKEYAESKGYRIEINKLAAKKNIVQVDIYDKQGLPTFNPVIIGELGKDNDASNWNKVKEAIDKREEADKAKAATDTNNGGKTAEDTKTGSTDPVKLHEIVVDLTAQRSTENPKGGNFVIGDSLNLPDGTKARVRANIEAIRLVKQIAAEGRIATPAEQEILSKYVGWGGLADAFGKPVSNRETRKIDYEAVKGLEAEFEELKGVLTEEEYKSARESTKNAHYTSIEVIKAMYDGLKQLGFTGGRMLEPSSGVGNFVGAMPADMTATVKSWTMVELDNITGLFAKYLYPNADVRIQGFEETNIPDGYMDVAIGNVPFGKYGVTDKRYPKAITGSIHNYFFAKALDKVRTGGIVMFITSSYTMNGRDSDIRKYIMQRADLLGAIRLPNTAFAGNAGTEVVTDILILKKRADRTEYAGEAFESSSWERIGTTGPYEGAYINEYFVQHPEMVLGTPKLSRSMYSSNELTYDPFTDRGTLGEQIREAFKNIQGKMEYSAQPSAERENFRQASSKKKHQKLVVKDGAIHAKDENGNVTKVDVDKDTAARIAGMVAIRDAHTALCDALQQGVTKQEATKLRKALNTAYDSFVEKYGYLNAPKNKKAINTFTDRYAIQSLENYSAEGKKITVTKADIFSKDTIAANRTAASAENVEEGLTICLNTVGRVDVDMVARLTGQKAESVTRQMIDQRLVFKDKDGNLIPAAQYLSGNVRAKLREMEGLTGIDSDYRNNVDALREVVPPTVQHTDIYVNPGATWVPVSIYEDFVSHILNRQNHTGWRTGKKDFSVEYFPETNEYKVSINDGYAKMSAQNTQVWGEGGKAFSTIFENMLNGRRTNVYMDNGDGTRVLDKAKTEAVAEKVEKLNEEFRKWLWEDESRRTEMQELYNEAYNAMVTPKYSGASLTVNGLNSEYDLRPHQKDAVARIINSGGNTLLAHRVGAGKTMEMAAAAMKLKQLGVIKKPMFVVPNNVVAQWGKEFKDYFPGANILVVGDEDMTPAERMTTINKIKNNDYDAVILAYTKFEKIQMTAAWRQRFYEEQIDSIMFAINAEKESQGGKGFTVKQLETKRKQLEAKLKKLTDKAKDEDGAMFEDLGVDALFVDEAHNFKNLEYSTRMNNVSGLGKADGAQRSFDLYTKVRYLQQLNGGRGVVFATATPVMNSMTEMYIMQKYLQPDTLKQLGIEHFDSWAKMFGEVVNALEIAPSGSGYRLKQTFSKFKNVKALQQLFRSFTDVLTDVPGLKIPKMKGRKVQIVECEQGEFQKNYMAELAKRAENVKNVDPSEDNMLKITSDGRKISYSQRMIDPTLPYEETGKIYRCCENVYAVYLESNKTKGTQMIFCDMATPKGKSSTKTETDADSDEFGTVDMESAQLYDDMKARLIQLGIPANEIAFIHDAKNDKQKAEMSEKMNNGTIRVLIGSTGKMGVGLNAQKKAVAIHHLDAPWRPGDIEQRDGRVFRQKNENEEAYKFVYVTRGSFDSRLWDILERKQKFINQVMNGEDVGNEIEDTGEVTLSAAEVKAVASDNPLIMEQVALEKEISKLQSLQQAHLANVSRAQEKIAIDRRNIANLENLLSNIQADIRSRKDTYSSEKVFSIQIGKQTYTDKKDAGAALVAAAQAQAKEGEYTDIGAFAGFTLRVVKAQDGVKGQIAGVGSYEFKTYPLNPTFGINHLIAVVEGFEEMQARWNKNLSEAKSDLETQKQIAAEPFDQAEKLKQKRVRYNEVMDILNPPKEEQSLDSDGGDTVQYQRRKSDRPDRRRALVKGEMINEFHDALTAEEWHTYYDKIIDGKYNPELFEDNDLATVTVNDKVLLVKMISNGEFSVIGVWKYQDMLPPEDVIKEMMNKYATSNYGENEIVSWLSRLVGYDGQKLFFPYNRHSGQYDGIAQQSAASSKNADGMSAETGGNGKGILAVPAGEGNGGDYTQNQQRTNTLTDREVLVLAASELQTADLTDGERDALGIFQQRLSNLETLQEERTELGRLYKEQQFGTKVDRAAAEQTRNRMKTMDGQIEKAKAEVLSIEDKQVLNRVLQKARKIVEKQQWIKDEEKLKRWRDRRNNADAIKKYRERLKKDVNDLTSWVLHPNNKDIVKHIPDALKSSVIPFLSSIDFTSKQALRGGDATMADQEFMKRLNGLKAALKPQQNLGDMYEGYTDLPPNFMDRLQTFIDAAQAIVNSKSGEFVVNQMTSNELRELSQVVRTLKEYIQNFNKFHYNAMFQHVHEAGDNTISELGEMDNASDKTGTVSNFVFWQQMRPAYAWERFGEGGKAIYDGLRRGQAKLAFNTKVIVDFSKKAYSEAEVKAWEKQIKEIQLGGDIVKMPVSTIMSLYELSKRPQALGHILGQGVRVATYKAGGKKISDVGHAVTMEDVQTIIGTLTDRQKEVADKLQMFMQEQGGKWGNYVSLKRFGEELFGEDHYFPINSDGRHLAANADEHPSAASLYALLNMGFTKSTTEGANNRLVLYSIFDIFANHMASMAQYNALALPVVDALKWFNYQQKSEPDENGQRYIQGSVRDQMDRVYGVPEETRPGSGRQGYAQTFVINILKAFNGTEAQGVPTDAMGIEALHRYNVAQVAYNFRVVVQQPLAITRAALLIDYGSIIKGMKLSPAAIKQNIQEMQRYSGIAAWKSLGFYDVNLSRGLTDLIKHNDNWMDKVTDVGMWGAEKADTLTWAGIWSACKEEVIKKQKLTPKSEGFYEAVTKLFEEVIYKTQVVDSVLTKNEYLRSKGLFARLTGSFMSEPTTTASMLIDAYEKYHADMQRGMTRQQAWKKNGRMIGRVAYVYGLSAVILAAVQAVADSFRDDDDYETWLEKWLEAFGGNLVDELMPFNKLPILSDFYDLAKELISIFGIDTYGNPPQSVFMQWYDSLVKGVQILYDRISGEDTNYTWYGGIYKLLQSASGITGLPMAAATREIVTAWNNIVGAIAPSLKVKTYEPGEKNEIKYAYQDGYLTDEEAAAELLKQGLVDNEDEAYWTVQGWEAGDGYSRYDAIFDAVRNGGDFNGAMRELTSHGYTEKDVLSQVKSKIGEWYKSGEITKQQATDMLTKYSGLDSEDITATVNKWSSKVVTGISFEDIKDEYLAGNITASRAIDMYVRYGGYTKEKATETVNKWRAEKETGIVYDDIKEAFMDGEISQGDAKNMYITYGGYSEEEAGEKVAVLAFVKQYPETDGISYAGVEAYQTYCQSSGVPAGTFYDAWKYNSSTSADVDASGKSISGSKKAKVLRYIHSLDLTYAQKDSLYYAFGWAKSTISEAPWH